MFTEQGFDIPVSLQHSLRLHYTPPLFLTKRLTHIELLQDEWQLPTLVPFDAELAAQLLVSHGLRPNTIPDLSGYFYPRLPAGYLQCIYVGYILSLALSFLRPPPPLVGPHNP